MREKTTDAILALKYWPEEWQLRVDFGKHVNASVGTKKKWRGRERKNRKEYLFLRLNEDWLESVHGKGFAVIKHLFVQSLVEYGHFAGIDHVLRIEACFQQGEKVRQSTLFAAKYGGLWAVSDEGPEFAIHEAIRPFAQVLSGEEFPEIPF